ncbi:serpentine type 7TM GPCR receptor class ab chemoreceptor domain-containing protein [Ditylenchus destructor]|uniref:Serpentine type 7TM GPCR receptor class ab chemoreceptor domain-containing protein n=1 Tax=Ditylenchus destructor TaxID=166010 RepID=A0AAD4MNF1_9BILA|nr:serpentine type 7TM GPCR receptor class ab chemoreceptor domain-containing protein [Ditylenchus destructor]
MTGDYVLNHDPDLCQRAKTMHEGAEIIFSQVGQIILAMTAHILLFIATMAYRKHRIALHPNLMLIVGNIIFLYALHSIYIVIFHGRYQLLLYFSSNPCDFLTPVWLNIALRFPRPLYIAAFTMSHLALTMERARATFMPTRYEKEGIRCPLFCLVVLWIIAIFVSSTIVALASLDQEFWQPSIHVNLTTNSNAYFLIYLHLVWLAVVIFIAIVDYILLVTNRKNRRR